MLTQPTHQLTPAYRSAVGLVCLAALIFGFMSRPGSIKAQQPTSEPATQTSPELTVTAIPPRLGDNGKIRIKPGEKIQVGVKVRNASNQTLRIDSQTFDFVLDEDGQTPVAITDTTSNRWSLANWMILSPSSQILKPNELGLVNVVIEAPADALPGGHYAMIAHRPSTNLTKQTGDTLQPNSASGVNQKVASLLYVVVEGPINEEAFVTGFHFPQLTEYGPVPFTFQVENVSDIHITPRTTVEITNLLGQSVAQIQVDTKNVFPLMKRGFQGSFDRIWGSGFYRATLTMSFGETGKVVVATTSFWLLPYRVLAASLAILLLLLGLSLFIRYRLMRRQRLLKQHLHDLEQKVSELEKHSSRS